MTFKETNLMFPIHTGRILVAPHDAEMIVHFSPVNRFLGLRDQFDTAHVLPVPVRRVVEREPGALAGARVVGVFVGFREGYVLVDGGGAVDVVLVRTDLIGPGPLVEVRDRGEVIEAAVPEEGGMGG